MKSTKPSTPLPASLRPSKSSTELIVEHVDRLTAAGVLQKTIAIDAGLAPNFVSMLKKGQDLPLARVLAFAKAAGLDEEQRKDLLHTRMLELHGERGDLCLETIAQWAIDALAPTEDVGTLQQMWEHELEPAPHLLQGLLADPALREKVRAAMNEVVQGKLRELAEEASMP